MPKQMIWGWNGKPATKEQLMDCVPGWGKIVSALIDDLFHLGWDGTIFQVKEKFGGLRFYIGQGTEEIFNRIQLAEQESLTTCEVCGEPGETYTDGWITTLCPKHAKEQGRVEKGYEFLM